MLRSLVGSEMCIRDRYQRRVRGTDRAIMLVLLLAVLAHQAVANRAPEGVSFQETSQVPHDGDPFTDTVSVILRPRATDPDGDPISYLWECPDAHRAEVHSYHGVFGAGEHVCNLHAADSFGATTTGNVTLAVFAEQNTVPVADAGVDTEWTVPHDHSPLTLTASVTLDGSGSSDGDGDPLTYRWQCDGVELDGGRPTEPVLDWFLPAGEHRCSLTVADPYNATSVNEVEVLVNAEPNGAPVASAGNDQELRVPHDMDPETGLVLVRLDGSTTADPDGDAMIHEWDCAVQGVPATAQVALSAAEQLGVDGDFFSGRFTHDVNAVSVMLPSGNHTCTLTSTDTYNATGTDHVQIVVSPEHDMAPDA
eukprot:TRINITY_DN11881_c0_g1_i17.p1 TRINITY_DN11881_c0_g1~~TRINITY_DN11881_c0_g1_i17.p1  ORF type:complete len:365 (-),score=76.13 TRINITY_DN11881_c0_g1_i17:319-1413(-)